jgi:hypothetical protein
MRSVHPGYSLQYKIFTVVSVVILGLYGCRDREVNSDLGQNQAETKTQIASIQAIKPATNHELTLYFQGKVVRSAPLLTERGYQISDPTGKIWVITHRSHWQIGQEVSFKGKVRYRDIILAGKQYGETYLEEE